MTERRDTVSARRAFFVWLVLAPLLLAREKLFLVDAAFKLAQLRKDGATDEVVAGHLRAVVRADRHRRAMPVHQALHRADQQQCRRLLGHLDGQGLAGAKAPPEDRRMHAYSMRWRTPFRLDGGRDSRLNADCVPTRAWTAVRCSE
jgi:hypothetical protein